MQIQELQPGSLSEWVAVLGLLAAVPLAACSGNDATGGNKTGGPSHTGTGGSAGAPATDAGGPSEPEPTMLPTAVEACPPLVNGNVTFLGQTAELSVGQRQEDHKAPVLFYWHGTGSFSGEASIYMGSQIAEVVAEGGLVASFVTSTGTGDYTGPFVWYAGDFAVADEILACAIQQLNIDTRRIYSAGCSAGGLQTSAMAYLRSGYLAAVMPNSGGTAQPPPLQDPAHVPAVMATHGAPGRDVVVIDFSTTSAALVADITAKGGFAVDCNHGGGHCGATPEVITAQWQFLKDHPFGVHPEPYAVGLPASFPSYCQIGQ